MTIGVIIIGIFLISAFSWLSQDKFKITKKICEDKQIGEEIIAVSNFTCNRTITFESLVCADWGCGKWHISGKFCYEYDDYAWETVYPCKSECNFDRFKDLGDGHTINDRIYIRNEKYVIQKTHTSPIFKNVCHEEEVDELEKKYQATIYAGTASPDFLKIYCDSENGTIEDNGNCLIRKRNIISKQDLTKEWLNENAESTDCKYYQRNTYMFKPTTKTEISKERYEIIKTFEVKGSFRECSKYKLGNYTITRK